jgi:hypothetical protein
MLSAAVTLAFVNHGYSPAGGASLPPAAAVTVRRAAPVEAPRRAIGSYGNAQTLDGRILPTKYLGELASEDDLPLVRGSHLGDMWYTKNDGHCWVLATVTSGSHTVGWVDP